MRRNEPGKMFSPELAVARAVGAQSPKNKKKTICENRNGVIFGIFQLELFVTQTKTRVVNYGLTKPSILN